MINKNMMGRKNPLYDYQTTYKQYKYSEEQEQQPSLSELIEVPNRFADGEDAYNNKRGRSPEVDRASRQRR
jgi:hypothetical protein